MGNHNFGFLLFSVTNISKMVRRGHLSPNFHLYSYFVLKTYVTVKTWLFWLP